MVILKDGEVVSRGNVLSSFNQMQNAEEALKQALSAAGLKKEDVSIIIATGAGKAEVTFADDTITEIGAAARGVIKLFPWARTVVDVGAEKGSALRMDENGKVIDFALNEKCAAGTGSFLEAMARALEVPLEELGPLSLKGVQAVPISAQCAVFAESEVISLIHARTPKADIARSINEALAGRISSMVRRVGLQKEIVLIGGMAKNHGFVRALEGELEIKVLVPDNPDFVSALGASLSVNSVKPDDIK